MLLTAAGYNGSDSPRERGAIRPAGTGTWAGTARWSSHGVSYGHLAAQWQGAGRGRLQARPPLPSAELYDPVTGLDGDRRIAPRATRIPRRCCPTAKCWSRGAQAPSASLASAELYDPATGTWTTTGPLATKRYYQTATLLPNGKVLLAGGYNGYGI